MMERSGRYDELEVVTTIGLGFLLTPFLNETFSWN
jgi:hypothetical protein